MPHHPNEFIFSSDDPHGEQPRCSAEGCSAPCATPQHPRRGRVRSPYYCWFHQPAPTEAPSEPWSADELEDPLCRYPGAEPLMERMRLAASAFEGLQPAVLENQEAMERLGQALAATGTATGMSIESIAEGVQEALTSAVAREAVQRAVVQAAGVPPALLGLEDSPVQEPASRQAGDPLYDATWGRTERPFATGGIVSRSSTLRVFGNPTSPSRGWYEGAFRDAMDRAEQEVLGNFEIRNLGVDAAVPESEQTVYLVGDPRRPETCARIVGGPIPPRVEADDAD